MTLLWPIADLPQVLETGCVHVWAWDFAGFAERLHEFTTLLSIEEQQRMQRFRFERDQVRYAICHGNVRRILASYLQLQPSRLQFEENDYGKPRLAQHQLGYQGLDSEFNFNLSHSTDVAVLAVRRGMEIGVDVEQIRPIETEVAEQYFSMHELMELESLTGQAWLNGFYNCWTRKEAILKAEGVGLNVRLDAFDVSLTPGALPRLIKHRADAGLTTDWELSALQPSQDSVGAVAINDVPYELQCWRLPD